MNESLGSELIDLIMERDPAFFEKVGGGALQYKCNTGKRSVAKYGEYDSR